MTADLYAALALANATIKNPTKDGSGNYGAYLTLDALLEAVRGPLAAHGLSIVQDVTDDDERVYVTTHLVHSSGQQLTVGPMSSPRGQNIQHAGAAVTYLRRFTLGAALGVAGEMDDDGQTHADQVKTDPRKSGSRAVRSEARASDKQVAYLTKLMREQKITEPVLSDFAKDKFGWELPTQGLAHLSAVHASDLIDALTKKVAYEPQPGRDYTPPGNEGTPSMDGDPWAAPLIDPTTGEVAR